jgi:hypothetical protein
MSLELSLRKVHDEFVLSKCSHADLVDAIDIAGKHYQHPIVNEDASRGRVVSDVVNGHCQKSMAEEVAVEHRPVRRR